jgi:hypothetical protein
MTQTRVYPERDGGGLLSTMTTNQILLALLVSLIVALGIYFYAMRKPPAPPKV